MKIATATVKDIRTRMGADASTIEAERLLDLLTKSGVEDTDEVSDPLWASLVATCIDRNVRYGIYAVSVWNDRHGFWEQIGELEVPGVAASSHWHGHELWNERTSFVRRPVFHRGNNGWFRCSPIDLD